MKILYFRPDTVDCTADPHYVNYGDISEMLGDVLRVLESSLVKSVLHVTAYNQEGGVLYESDTYSTFKGSYGDKPPTRKLAEGEYAKIHKVEGLYFSQDAKRELSIPPGLTGYKRLMDRIPNKLPVDDLRSISIAVAWTFANGGHSCSDYITINPGDMTVDYSNQDEWMTEPGYEKHCADLGFLIGHNIEPGEPDEE